MADEEARAAWHEKEKEYDDIITPLEEAIPGAKKQIALFDKQLAQRNGTMKDLKTGAMKLDKKRMLTDTEWDSICANKALQEEQIAKWTCEKEREEK